MKELSSSDLKKLLLEGMDVVDRFCKEYEIPYFLIGGSLLGAVRHKGFIPWDDDLDIAMKRDDYNRFMKFFPGYSQRFELISFEIDNSYYLPSAKVIDNTTIVHEIIPKAKPIGVYIDIFPLDYLPGDYHTACAFSHRLDFFRNVLSIKNTPLTNKRGVLKNLALGILKICCSPISRKNTIKAISSRASELESKNCNYLGELTNNVYRDKEIYPIGWFDSTVELEFEGRLYQAPVSYVNVLKKTFGDYMKLPPKEKQVTHHGFNAWLKEENQ